MRLPWGLVAVFASSSVFADTMTCRANGALAERLAAAAAAAAPGAAAAPRFALFAQGKGFYTFTNTNNTTPVNPGDITGCSINGYLVSVNLSNNGQSIVVTDAGGHPVLDIVAIIFRVIDNSED